MNLKLSPWRSLKTRVTLFTLVIFVFGIWLLAFYASRMLREDIQALLGAQQYSAVSILAAEVDHELRGRFSALEEVASRVDSTLLNKPAALQTLLEQHAILQRMFNGGVVALRPDGTAVVEAPVTGGRTGVNYIERDDVLSALKQGKAAIGKPHLAKRQKNPEFGMAVPIRDAQGQVIGALKGEINLALPNFLDTMTDTKYGQGGGQLLVEPQRRLIITATDKNRVMEALPAAGLNPVLDRFIGGYEGSAVFVNPLGVEVLASVKQVPLAGWYVASILPAANAFAPIRAMQQRLLIATLLLTLLAGALTWWLLRRQLAPLLATAKTLAALQDSQRFPTALPISRHDEIGQLISGFNHLLETLRQRENLLTQILDTSSVAIFVVDMQGRITQANQRMAEMFGCSPDALVGAEYVALVHPAQREVGRQNMLALLAREIASMDADRLYWRADQSEFWGHLTGKRFHDATGEARGLVGVIADITKRKQAEARIVESEERFRTLIEESPTAIAVHRNGEILYVNPAAVKIFGANSAREIVGKPILDLVAPESHRVVQARLGGIAETGIAAPLINEKYLRLDGTSVDVEVQSSAIIYDGQAAIRTAFRDITERKLAHEKLQLAASVFTHAREGIVITDAMGDIIDVNEAFSRITGYSREEVLGRNPRLLSSGRQSKEFYAAMWRDLSEKDHWYGEVWNRRKNGELYSEMLTISTVRDEHGAAQHYVALFSDITLVKEHQRELEHIAHFDALTNLPNRMLLADRLHQGMASVQRRSQRLAVAYLDLDGFKSINDKHGHEAGDMLLMTVAARMKQTLREGDTLARIGGDEFVAVLLDLNDNQASAPMLKRLLVAAAEPVRLGELVLQVSASLGVTFFPQADEVEADQLLRQADQAMYQAKLAGKNRYHFFDPEQDRSMRGHHESLERIDRALAEHEFVLYYQPKVNMRTGAVIGVEALIRWQHPQQGLLLPADFLPVIEDHPLAVDIGEWVISSALAQIELWQAQGLDIPISVNVGARQLQQADFVQRLRELLAAHPRVKPSLLEIEVLETSALEDLVGVSRVIEDCHQMGVMFAMDDFGTGYSSLTYLKRLRVTLLKVDQSFVRDMLDDPDDRAILEGVIGLASAFQRNVIAEGVETIAHGTLLLQLGYDLAQGYGIARPMPAALFPAWAAAWQRDAAWVSASAP